MRMKNLLRKVHHKYYVKLFPNYGIELERAVEKCKSLLDVGCGSNSPIKSFSKKLYCVGVDAFYASIEKSKKIGDT